MEPNKVIKPTVDDSADEPGSLDNEGESLEFLNPTGPAGGSVISPSKTENSDRQPSPDGASSSIATDPSNEPDVATTNAITPGQTPRTKHFPLKALWERINIYLLLFIFVIAVSLVAVAVIYFKNRSTTSSGDTSIAQQKLSADSLQELATNGVQVGDPKQILNIQSNSVFAGTVLVKGELQVAGGLKIGSGSLNIPDVNIGGTALINDLQTKSLAVASNTAIQGQLTVQQSLSVNGGGAFNGPVTTPLLTAGKLQLSGDLILTRHLVAGGSIPGRSNGGGLGNGGTSSNSGSDTAGFISINTGSGASGGCLVTINFSQAFSTTPHVMVTPIGAAAAGMDYYVNRSTTNFSLCSASTPPSNQSFGFDYIVLD